MEEILRIEDLQVHYPGDCGPLVAVDGVSLSLRKGETYALVGESGCGKTATGLALLRLVEPGHVAGGRIVFEGRDLLRLTEREMRAVRGARIGMVFQEPMSALDPVMRIGWQVAEAPRVHKRIGRRAAWDEAVRLLGQVALADPEGVARSYSHELSGGMAQRVMMAIALSGSPSLLIADEPTTALDVTIQAQALELLRKLKSEFELTVLLITHDLGVVAENADRVGVMYAGKLVEEGPVADLFERPLHPYTQGLLDCLPERPGPGDGRLPTLPGNVPDPENPPSGCRFHPRCTRAFEPCAREVPAELTLEETRRAACFLHDPRYRRLSPAGAPGGEETR